MRQPVTVLGLVLGSACLAATAAAAAPPPVHPLAPELRPEDLETPSCLGMMPDGSGVLLYLSELNDGSLTNRLIVAFKMAPGKKAPFGATVVEGSLGPPPPDLEGDVPWDDAGALLARHVPKINAGMRKAGLLACRGGRGGPRFAVEVAGVPGVVEDSGRAVMVTSAPGAKPVRVRGLEVMDDPMYGDLPPRELVTAVFHHPVSPHLFVVIAFEQIGFHSEHRGVLVVTPEKLRPK